MLINITQTTFDKKNQTASIVGIDLDEIGFDANESEEKKVKFTFHLDEPNERSYIMKVIYSRGDSKAKTPLGKLESMVGQIIIINWKTFSRK